jgi:manganese/zinc/iron transport system permease protein
MTAVFLQFDLPSLLLGILAALSCAIVGNFLLLRRQSLMGDTISHVVLPGIVGGYLLVGTMSTWAMMGGAGVAALVSVVLIAVVRDLARVESGAAMGLVFTTMFALGVVMLEQSGARAVHLDVEHALYGNLESAVWLEAESWGDLLVPEKLLCAARCAVAAGVRDDVRHRLRSRPLQGTQGCELRSDLCQQPRHFPPAASISR